VLLELAVAAVVLADVHGPLAHDGPAADADPDVQGRRRDVDLDARTDDGADVPEVVTCAPDGIVCAGSVAQTAAFGELLINATSGVSSLDALAAADRGDIEGKVMIDLSNPLDFSSGMPPTLAFCNTESLGERIQAAYPGAKVVKALNTVSVAVMVAPDALPDETDLLVAGNDPDAKRFVIDEVLKGWLGWRRVIDLGDISNARGTEMYLPLWVRLFGITQTPLLNIKVVSAS